MHIAAATLGRLGEWWCACRYWMRGYRVLARNVRLRSGEIDIVARRGATLVIAEVKTRQSLRAGEGHLAVDREKRARLVRLAEQYVRSDAVRIRYDILSLHWTGWRFRVSHYQDAFRPQSDPARPWKWQV
jgi:putative endonuclease